MAVVARRRFKHIRSGAAWLAVPASKYYQWGVYIALPCNTLYTFCQTIAVHKTVEGIALAVKVQGD